MDGTRGRNAYADWNGHQEGLASFIEVLKKGKDPEYQKYLELKAKFEAKA